MNNTKKTTEKINYNHLSFEQRVIIKTLHNEGRNQQYIADTIGCQQSTVSRELSRNLTQDYRWFELYKPKEAQQLYKDRRTKANNNHNLYMKHKELQILIEKLLEKHSPDVIANRILKEETHYSISTATIYNYIRYVKPELRRKLHFKFWYKKHWTPKKQKICPELPRVHMRSDAANNREEIGHREADSVVSVWHRWWVTTLTERYSRYMLLKRSQRLDASTTLFNMITLLEGKLLKTITSDNGSEFAFLEVFIKRMI
jgi:transposase, IS30 family